jgi:hypothetical protein
VPYPPIPPPFPPVPPSPTCPTFPNGKDSCVSMIASIAAQQYSLAMIINSEGEQIQKMIASAECCSELIDVTEAARRLINDLTDMERYIVDALNYVTCLCGCTDVPKLDVEDICGPDPVKGK